MGRNLLYCKGCKHLCTKTIGNLESLYCDLDRKFKAVDKQVMWVQYSNVCPLQNYMGKADFETNPIVFSESD